MQGLGRCGAQSTAAGECFAAEAENGPKSGRRAVEQALDARARRMGEKPYKQGFKRGLKAALTARERGFCRSGTGKSSAQFAARFPERDYASENRGIRN
jgi:hypothetical protein